MIPSFLYESSNVYFSHPIGTERFSLVGFAILRLLIPIVLVDFVLCLILYSHFSTLNTTTDPKRTNRKKNPWYSFSLLTSDYPGRWFFLHAIWNFGITIACIPDIIESLNQPSHACSPKKMYNLMPTLMSMSLHLYHCCAPWFWHKLTKEDFFHHIVFAIGGLGSVSVLWSWGPGANFSFFFLTGFPGGLDYFMLGLVKLRLMNRMKEKEWNSFINAWIRGPGCTAAAAFT
jgi:hypothetical protein